MSSRGNSSDVIPDDDPGWNGDIWTGASGDGYVFVARNVLKSLYDDPLLYDDDGNPLPSGDYGIRATHRGFSIAPLETDAEA